jgi:metal-responsive CopG/Arc/MetJ family transcriptional regulator
MTGNNMPSKRIDITLDPKIIDKLDELVAEYGTSSSRSAMIAMLILERYNRIHKVK